MGRPRFDEEGGHWHVSRMADVVALASHPAVSANYLPSLIIGAKRKLVERDIDFDERYADVVNFFSRWVLFTDGRDQAAIHRFMSSFFTNSKVERLRPYIAQETRRLLRTATKKQDSAQPESKLSKKLDCEFVEWDLAIDLANWLPLHVAMEAIGLPNDREDVQRFKRWTDIVEVWFGGEEVDVEKRWDDCKSTIREYIAYMNDVIERHRERSLLLPKGSVLSEMLEATESGNFADELLLPNVFFLMAAAHETTSSLIANGWLALSLHPRELEWLRRRTSHEVGEGRGSAEEGSPSERAVMKAAIDELLRYVSPIKRMYREVREDFEYQGYQFRRGQMVQFVNATANLDPDSFQDPLRLDLTRYLKRMTTKGRYRATKHIGFGCGVHTCIGARLARLQAEVVFLELLRVPSLRLRDLYRNREVSKSRGPRGFDQQQATKDDRMDHADPHEDGGYSLDEIERLLSRLRWPRLESLNSLASLPVRSATIA